MSQLQTRDCRERGTYECRYVKCWHATNWVQLREKVIFAHSLTHSLLVDWKRRQSRQLSYTFWLTIEQIFSKFRTKALACLYSIYVHINSKDCNQCTSKTLVQITKCSEPLAADLKRQQLIEHFSNFPKNTTFKQQLSTNVVCQWKWIFQNVILWHEISPKYGYNYLYWESSNDKRQFHMKLMQYPQVPDKNNQETEEDTLYS